MEILFEKNMGSCESKTKQSNNEDQNLDKRPIIEAYEPEILTSELQTMPQITSESSMIIAHPLKSKAQLTNKPGVIIRHTVKEEIKAMALKDESLTLQ
ncbi:MAG: hypothetical protein ACJA02_000717 [Myxococcota bacterium]